MHHSTLQTPDWTCVTPKADWQARDSMGDAVYRDHLWIFGGWFTPQTPNPRDVWKSPDGKTWTCVQPQAPWEESDLPVALAFRDKLWLMGGRRLPGTECSNTVWSSDDGVTWKRECEHAAWSPRLSSGYTVFQDAMWVLGGTGDFYDHSPAKVTNDVWASPDGKTWTCVTPQAGWSPRAHGQAVVFQDKLWVLGGGLWHPEHVAANDVWCSPDGKTWTCVTEAAPWAPRLWFTALVYRDRLWVMGGWSRENGNFGDVWTTADGLHWSEMRAECIWTPRHEHSAYLFQDSIWVAGGHAEPLTSEVWSLHLPPDWFADQAL